MLYLTATPIGNLEDITLRAVRVLGEVDCIYAEDTRNSGILLNHLNIKKPLISCHEHNEAMRAEEIVDKLREGQNIAFISDAGMPGISDPGARLVSACIENGLPYTVLPGASAVLSALVLSGMDARRFTFAGFLPRDGKERKEAIMSLAAVDNTIIIYESPQRAADTFLELSLSLGDRSAALVREITKLYEESCKGTLKELAQRYEKTPPKGECVIVIAGKSNEQQAMSLDDYLRELMRSGYSVKDAAKQASAVLDVKRNAAYARAEELKASEQ